MLRYRPGDTLAHRTDARTKLALQVAFAAAAYANTTPRGLLALTGVALAVLGAARAPPHRAVAAFRFPMALLVVAPLLAGLTPGPPWFSIAEAAPSALAAYRVALILLVAAAVVRTTPLRESRAAIEWIVPGRPGRFLSLGVVLVGRFLPLFVADLRRGRDAVAVRLGETRPLHERLRLVAAIGLRRAFERADRLSLALRARCLSWNPTLPALQFGRADVVGWVAVAGLVAFAAA